MWMNMDICYTCICYTWAVFTWYICTSSLLWIIWWWFLLYFKWNSFLNIGSVSLPECWLPHLSDSESEQGFGCFKRLVHAKRVSVFRVKQTRFKVYFGDHLDVWLRSGFLIRCLVFRYLFARWLVSIFLVFYGMILVNIYVLCNLQCITCHSFFGVIMPSPPSWKVMNLSRLGY